MRLVAVDSGVTAVVSGFLTTVASAKVVSRTLCLFALMGAIAGAQQPAAPVTVSGAVTASDDRTPLPRVRVAVAGTAGSEASVLTDARGHFQIAVADVASVRLAFRKTGYLSFALDVPTRVSTDRDTGLRVRLMRAGAISGRVSDQRGSPLRVTLSARRVGAPATSTPLSTNSNDLGEYRFGGLSEGTYIVTARPPLDPVGGPEARAVERTALPLEASPTNVRAGEESGNVNLTFNLPLRTAQRTLNSARSDGTSTTAISGRVVGQDGIPVAGVSVLAMQPASGGGWTTDTDADGRYRLDRLPPGAHTVSAMKNGYLTRSFGQVSLREGREAGSIDFTLSRGGAIAGTIVDEFGDPVEGVVVDIRQILTVEGRQRVSLQNLILGTQASLRASRTDDQGRYRIIGLQPGSYVVQAVAGGVAPATASLSLSYPVASSNNQVAVTVTGAEAGSLPLYYPGTFSINQATQVTVTDGADVVGIDLVFRPQHGHRVAGTVTSPDGRPARISVELAGSDRSGTIETEPLRQMTTSGSFAFAEVGPGEYVVQATASGDIPTGRAGFGTAFVVVGDADPAPVHLTLTAGATLTGRVTYEGMQESMVNIPLTVRSVDRDRGPRSAWTVSGLRPRRDGTFELGGLFGEASLISRSSGADWYVKSILLNGRDILDTPYDFSSGGTIAGAEIVLSAGVARITGRVTDERLAPVTSADVVIFPANRDKWVNGSQWVKAVRPVQDGTFTIPGVPPGDYLIAAIDRLDAGSTTSDHDLLDSISFRATRFSLNQGQTQDVTLRLIRR